MNQSENNFEEQWRKAFEEASETPPPSVWDAIEAKLNEKEEKRGGILPLWWNPARIGYAAAAIALLLVVGWVVFSSKNGIDSTTPQMANRSQGGESRPKSQPQEGATPTPSLSGKEVAVSEKQTISSAKTPASVHADIAAQRSPAIRQVARAGFSKESSIISEVSEGPGGLSKDSSVRFVESSQSYEVDVARQAGVGEEEDGLELLTARGFQELPVSPRRRYVFYDVRQHEKEIVEPEPKREYWAGVGLMPASFNPDLNVKSAPIFNNVASLAGQSYSSKSVSSGNTSRAGLSYAIQAHSGVKLSKNWSIETGISYLKGNSIFKSSGYVLDNVSSRTTNALENAIYAGTNVSSPDYILNPTADKAAAEPMGIYIDVSQEKSNDYSYLQLPVQVGYTLNPAGKLSYTVLGGMVANLFLNNQLETNAGIILTTKGSDNVYRNLNWAGSSGLRFNYRMSPHWIATMTGSFQKSVTTIFKSNDNLESKPSLYGVGWGIRYTF